jgi:hypothetical protein
VIVRTKHTIYLYNIVDCHSDIYKTTASRGWEEMGHTFWRREEITQKLVSKPNKSQEGMGHTSWKGEENIQKLVNKPNRSWKGRDTHPREERRVHRNFSAHPKEAEREWDTLSGEESTQKLVSNPDRSCKGMGHTFWR